MPEKKTDLALIMLSICWILAYLLPYHMYPFMAFYNDWLAIFGIVLLLFFFARNFKTSIRLPWILFISAGLMTLIFIQSALGLLTSDWDMVLAIAYLTGGVIAMISGATLSAEPEGSRRLCSTVAAVHLIAGLISSLIATLQIIGQEGLITPLVMMMPHKGIIRPFANLGQSNQLALLFCLGIASTWYLYQTGKLRAITSSMFTLILLWGLALAQSRIGWLIVPMMLFFSVIWRDQGVLKSIPALQSAALALGYVIFVWVLPEIDFGVVSNGRMPSPEDRLGSIFERWIMIRQAWQISLSHPWLGAGWFEFGPQQLSIGADFPPAVYSRHAHNIVMNFAAELGWPATILIFTSLSYWFYQSCLSPMLNRTLIPEIGYAILFLSSVFIHSLLEFPLWYAYVLMPTALLMGVVHYEQLNCRAILMPRIFFLVLSLLTGAGLLSIAIDYQRLVNGFLAHGWENFGLKADEGSTEMPEWTVFPHFYDYFRFTKTKARENMRPDEIAFMEHTAKRFGYPSVMMRMSLIYALNGRDQDAVRTIKSLKNLHPRRYREAYGAWRAMAKYDPLKYADVFTQIPPPDVRHKAESR